MSTRVPVSADQRQALLSAWIGASAHRLLQVPGKYAERVEALAGGVTVAARQLPTYPPASAMSAAIVHWRVSDAPAEKRRENAPN
jgi:hypothetical protein